MLLLDEPNVYEKLRLLDLNIELALSKKWSCTPDLPARDIDILPPNQHPVKMPLSRAEGQARLLHDLASIELQAMELGLRTLINFPEAPEDFKQQLAEVTREEAKHLELCLSGIRNLGFQWGDWPIHCQLWECTSDKDDLIDRILIVHRYLEGSGLDASDSILTKLKSNSAAQVKPVVEVIARDEVLHVLFGSYWFNRICLDAGLNPEFEFSRRLNILADILPKRRQRINVELRKSAGFSDFEIRALESHREKLMNV